ncbi:MAG TPA: UbiA-like polyprenyltransferase [Gemmatimonadales bacterium]|nr:UbiA-like polyprenyltransferase [Gemmatimonadales bacterium]
MKLPHTLFALPFALVGMLGASHLAPITGPILLWIVVAFSAARFAAMGFNRIVDRRYDALNPRTAQREIPRGAIGIGAARVAVLLASALFVIAARMLNPLCFYLAPVALLWVLGYSYAKRFTTWPHLWLGLGLGIAPVGGWLAVTGTWSTPWWLLPLVALAVMTWVAGFDIFYALPDAGFDVSQGLRSVVVRFGERRAILVAKLLHGVTIPALALFGWQAGFGWWYAAGLVLAALILAYEHRLVQPGDLSRLDAAFFTMNGVMSVTVFAAALVDRMM